MRGEAATSPEAVWRKALEARGREWVTAELRRRPGQPRDPLLEVVFEEPYPTREFSQQWCAEEENRFRFVSWSSVAAGVMLVIVVICGIHAVSSRDEQRTAQSFAASRSAGMAGSPRPETRSAPLTNDIPKTSGSGTGSQPSPTANSVPAVCAYQTYPTAACPAMR